MNNMMIGLVITNNTIITMYDLKRRERYRLRHKNDKINDPTSSGFLSWWFLW